MAKITLDNVKAPPHTDFPKLAKIRADELLAEARDYKLQIAALTAKLKKLGPRIEAKLETALDPDVKSIVYIDLLVSRRAGYTKRSLDTKWAMKKLIAKGVKKAEIDEHTKETEVEPGISMQLLEEGDGSE